MSQKLIAKRVRHGAELLDRILPGWFLQIDVETLDLAASCNCVLGQLAVDIVPRRQWFRAWRKGGDRPEYAEAYEQLKLTHAKAASHGFNLDNDNYGYDELTTEWKRYIARRQRSRWMSR
jgi:hypothetical protein